MARNTHTVAQLAVCGYKAPSTTVRYKRYYVKDFFPSSVLDPTPFSTDAKVVFQYETDEPTKPQDVTVSRARHEWSGYKRQPERECYYVGFTIYIPKVEHRDLSVYRAAQLALGDRELFSDEAKQCVGRILNQQYDTMAFQTVTHGTKDLELGIAGRFGKEYSENHMGFGEGRVFYMTPDLLT